MSDLNVNNVFVNDQGRVQFSGLQSGIDFVDVVDKMVEARRIPAVTLETRIDENDTTIAALNELKNLVSALKGSLDNLYGKVSFDDSTNVFETKQAFASSQRADATPPTAATSLLGVTVSNQALTGVRTLEIEQIATAQKLAGQFAGTTSAAAGLSGTLTFGAASGTTKSVTVVATDSLADIRDRINATTDDTGMSASVVQVSATESYLMLNADQEGVDNRISTLSDTGNVLSTLGLGGNATSNFVTNGTLASALTLQINGNALSFTAGQTVSDIKTAIDALALPGVTTSINPSGADEQLVISGTVDVVEKSGTIGLSTPGELQKAQNAIVKLDGLASPIERSTNTVDDLIEGVTLNLFAAEDDTTITLDIQEDLNSIKTEISGFVDAYNDVQRFINEKTFVDPITGEAGEDAVLLGNTTVNNLERLLQQMSGGQAVGVIDRVGVDDYEVLRDIGLEFVTSTNAADPLDVNTLKVDDTTLDNALLTNLNEVEELFNFDFTSDNPNIQLLGFTPSTSFASAGYNLSLQFDNSGNPVGAASAVVAGGTLGANLTLDVDGNSLAFTTGQTLTDIKTAIDGLGISGVSASVNGDRLFVSGTSNVTETVGSIGIARSNIDGVVGSVTVSGTTITATDKTGAEGLRMFYGGTGAASPETATLNFTLGIGSQLFNEVERALGVPGTTGSLDAEIENLENQSDLHRERIETIDERLEIFRESMLDRFIAMEEALSTMKRILDSFAALTGTNNNN